MLEMSQLLNLFKHVFQDKSYGQSIEQYILKHNPQSPGDIERLERQWQHRNGGMWL
jgi:hypothetical protein